MIVFSNADVFSSRFRYHTLAVVKESCLPFFSEKQQLQLPTIQQIVQNRTTDSWMYLYDNDEPVPKIFENAFAWKGVYMSIIEYPSIEFSSLSKINIDQSPTEMSNFIEWLDEYIGIFKGILSSEMPVIMECFDESDRIFNDLLPLEMPDSINNLNPYITTKNTGYITNYFSSLDDSLTIRQVHRPNFRLLNIKYGQPLIIEYHDNEKQRQDEAESARSGRCNTLPKRPKVDKFKNRFGPKEKKCR
ncbi:unnamed protein product [Rotaria sp. Silwood2]|nr:unnamed protein product [Rotaria sp. Silwood2]CAF4501707.1 unnamed protein product [Rotaria sp. Silwood2]